MSMVIQHSAQQSSIIYFIQLSSKSGRGQCMLITTGHAAKLIWLCANCQVHWVLDEILLFTGWMENRQMTKIASGKAS